MCFYSLRCYVTVVTYSRNASVFFSLTINCVMSPKPSLDAALIHRDHLTF